MSASAALNADQSVANQKKVTVSKDPNRPNEMILTIVGEDHIIGKLLGYQLLRDSKVMFAGFDPHQASNKVVLKVETIPDYDPAVAFKLAITDLLSKFSSIGQAFAEEMEEANARCEEKNITE